MKEKSRDLELAEAKQVGVNHALGIIRYETANTGDWPLLKEILLRTGLVYECSACDLVKLMDEPDCSTIGRCKVRTNEKDN